MVTCVQAVAGAEDTDGKQNKSLPPRSSCFTVSVRGCGCGCEAGPGDTEKEIVWILISAKKKTKQCKRNIV